MPNKIYTNPETAKTFRASGGDVAITLTSLGAGAGRQSAQLDLGTTARSNLFSWRFWVKFATQPVVGEAILLFIKTSDGTHIDNDDGTGDIDVSAEDKLRNLTYIGSLIVDEATASPSTVEFSASGGPIEILGRYVQLVVWNGTADALSGTAGDHGFDLQPIPLEVQ